MARRRKPRRSPSGGAAPIRFANLDGSDASNQMLGEAADDEMVDPLDSEPGERWEEPAQRADDDPFADDADDDNDVELDDASDPIEDATEDAAGIGDDDPEDDEDDPKTLREQLAAERARLAALEREREQERQERDAATKELAEAKVKRIDDDLAATRAALKTAIEEGETDKQVELQDRLAELHALKREVGKQPAQAARQATAAPVLRPMNAAAEAWMRGKTWINSPTYVAQNEEVLRVARVLIDDGYDASKSEYYQELERRLARKHPELFPVKPAATPQKRLAQQVGRVSRDDPPQQRRQNSRAVKLTKEDLRNMERFGLSTDPNTKEGRRALHAYAANKIA